MPTPAADRIAALSFDPTLDLPSAIRRIAAITPDAPALSGGAQSYSYSALLAAADRIAAHLRAAGVAPGDPVAVIAERRPETIVAILGTHRAGALCLPLDPAYDRERLAFYLADARPTALIVDRTHAAMAADLDAALPAKARPCLELATVLASPAPDTAGLPAQSGDDAGFLFYTSGSTGRPKGVLVPHRAITRLAHGCPSGPLTPDDVSIASSTLACDGAGWEIWPALLGGAEVVVVTQPKPALDVIAKTMSEAGATYASLYTGIAHLMIDHHPEALAGLRQLHAGGDVLSVAALTRLRAVAPKLQVVNCYGPTENGVVTTAHVVTEADLTAGAIPIGRPFHAEDCFVLGDDGALLGTGEIGQLVAAGPGVALGYLGRPELSDAAFIDDPRPGRSGKVYLTGDLVARRADGVYAFHGRADRQVKLGGRRIELDEIEQALRALPMLADAAVVLAPAPTGPARIAGFAVPAGEMPADRAGFGRAVQAALGAVLPAGLVPQLLRVVPVLPLTEAGKVDRKGLVAALEAQPRGLELDQPVPDQPKTAAKAAPMTAAAIELLIAELWDAALGCGPVDRDATFFEAGGTSLQLVDLHAQLVEALGRRFDITLLFEVPRLGAQAARLAALLSENTEEVAPAPSQTPPQAPQPKAPRRAHSAPQHAPGDETAAIAITGMAARLPGVESLDDFWSQLRAGTNLVRPHAPEDLEDTLPPERRASPAYQPVRPDLPDAALFDAKFFGMYPREAAVTDPQARLLLELAYEALEASGHDPFAGTLPVGVFAGASLSTYLLHNLIADRAAAEDYAQTYQTGKFAEMTGNLGDCLATRVAYKLNLRGPAITVQTACSTSLTAIAQAVLALRAGQCDMALAGGVSITFPQKRGYIAQEGGLASDDGTCRPFDAAASGTVFSHGGGVVVLRRLDEALADGDRVHAVIRGVGLNNDGADKIAFTAPSVTGQAAAILMAQADAGVAPETVSYVECHGTATPLGDPVEVQGLRKAFGAGLAEGSCALGSVKGNIGHLDAAAGVTAVLKTALMLTHKIVPPVANFTKLNPKITLDGTPFRVPQVAEAWRAPGPLRAGVSAFGVGGTNVHLVLEEAPVSAAVPVPGPQVLPLSAKSPEALGAMQARLAEALEAEGAPALGDVAFTLQEGRPGFAHRAVFAGDDPARLAAALRDTAPPRTPAGEAPEVTFLFPGQGAQYPGMGRGLYAAEPEYARWIDQGAEILQPQLGCDIRALLCAADPSDKAAATALRETRLTQPALFLTQYACAKLWQARGVVPGAMIGHSVGELTAATLAGVMRFETGLEVIAKRGALMQAQPAGAMLSVRAPFEAVEPYLDASIDLAARNAPKASVLAGGLEAIAALEAKLAEAGLACTRLHTSHAFHSAMMDPVAAGLCEALAEVPLAGPEIPFVSTVTGDWITPAEATDPGYWGRQARATVDFEGALLRLGSGPRVLVEIGAGATLSTFAHQTLPREGGVAVVQSLPDHRRATPDTEAMARAFGGLWAAGVAVDWARLGPRGRARVPLPSYPFERQRHWVAPPAPVATPAAPAALPAHREDLPMPSVPAAPVQSPAQTPDQTKDRKPRLVAELCTMLSEISGEALTAEDAARPFLDLGFDSLFLGQVSQKLGADYGVELSFRQLLGELPSIAAVAAHLDAVLPAEQAAPPAAAAPVPTTPVPAAPVAAPAVPTADGSVTALMQAQLTAMQELIAQQMAVLTGGVAPAPPAPTAAAPAPTTPAPQAAPEPAPAQPDHTPRSFSIGRATQAGPSALTEAQAGFARDLAARHSAHSPKSKAYVQRHRAVLADPRSAAGFRPEWKELVYPVVADRAKAARIWDIDGHEYIDLVNGFGQTAFGHSPDFVIEAITAQMQQGFAIGPQSDRAGPVAERFAKMVGHQRATFCNTGSEAVMAAMRVARTVTGRDTIVVFSQDYHGQFDEVLVKARRSGAPGALPIAPGIPRASLANMVVLPYDDPATLDWIAAHVGTLAAVVVEPVQSRNPDLRPRDFVQRLREITRAGGAALVIDEVVTGFRVGPRGMQGVWGIEADLATYGKVMGGGMPIGMLAGTRRFMDALDGGAWSFGDDSQPEAAPTFFAGTFVRHPLVLAAVDATLAHLETHGEALWTDAAERTARAVAAMNAGLAARGLPALVETYASWFMPKLTERDPNAALLYPLMRLGGVHMQLGYAGFVTTAHSTEDLDRVVAVFLDAVDRLQSVGILAPEGTAVAGTATGATDTAPVEALPLTEAQREIWMTSQQGARASCAFNESVSFALDGPLDLAALQRALDQVIARHDGLRQVFSRSGESFDILPPFSLDLAPRDLSGEDDPEAALAALIAEDAGREIDLTAGPPLRGFLARLGAERHVLVLNAHHIVCDGWSYTLVGRDLAAFYRAALDGGTPELPAAPSFAAYARAQAKAQTSAQTGAQTSTPPAETTEAYWRDQFAELPALPELPTDRPRPARKSFRGATLTAGISGETLRAARTSGAAKGCTLFATLFAALQIVIGRLSGSHDVVIGVPTAGQTLLDDQSLVGHCVNFLPIRAKQNPAASLADHLAEVRDQVMAAFDHRDTTFGALVRGLDLPRALDRLPLTEVQFNLERLDDGLAMGPVEMRALPNPKQAVNFDLFFNVIEQRDGLRVDVDYNTDVFSPETVARWIGHLETVLGEIGANPAQPLGTVPVMTPDQERWLIEELNATATPLPAPETLPARIAARAAAEPDKVALVCGPQEMRYGALKAASDAVAGALQALGLGAGARVAVALPRSVEAVAALLGVMTAGHAFVPLDPAQPPARLRRILETAEVGALIHAEAGPPAYAEGLALSPLPLAEALAGGQPRPVALRGDDSAYVIFTSGSTGTPKGVEIAQRSVVNLLSAMARRPGFGADDSLLAVTTTMFDISILELFLPLMQGGRVVIAPQADVLDGFKLVARLAEGDITHLQATPTLWQMLIEAGFAPGPGLTLMAGGEPLPGDLATQLTAGGAALWNLYGPTETTIWSAAAEIAPGQAVTIGGPVDNTALHVLGPGDVLLPPGAVGELNIGGLGLAKGYVNRPDLTAAAFREVVLGGQTRRLYKTGDLARRLPDGRVQLLGREDGQVKLRGFRIELGEIEAAIRAEDGVRAAAVALKPSPRGDQLVGYVVAQPGQDPAPARLAEAVAERLPGYMVPSAWVGLSALPQTANGKLDRKALPDPAAAAPVTALARPPATDTERQIAAIWCEVLGVETVGTDETLFALGADSLTVFRIAARLIDAGLNVEARHMLEHPTIAALAAYADRAATGDPAKPRLKAYRRGARRGAG